MGSRNGGCDGNGGADHVLVQARRRKISHVMALPIT